MCRSPTVPAIKPLPNQRTNATTTTTLNQHGQLSHKLPFIVSISRPLFGQRLCVLIEVRCEFFRDAICWRIFDYKKIYNALKYSLTAIGIAGTFFLEDDRDADRVWLCLSNFRYKTRATVF